MKGFYFIKPTEVTTNEYLPRGSSLAALSLSKTFATRICPVVSSTTNYNRGSRTAHPSQDREKSQRVHVQGQCSFILLSPLCEVIRLLCQFFLLSLLIYILFCAELKLIISVHKFIDTKGRVPLVNLHFEYKLKSTIQTKILFHTIDNK